MLVGAQIAVLGAVLGIAVGFVIGAAMRALLIDLTPLPLWLTDFQPGIYPEAADLGALPCPS